MNDRKSGVAFRAGRFQRRIAWVFGLQCVTVAIVCVMGVYDQAPLLAVIAVIAITTVLAWLATRHEWLQVHALARLLEQWHDGQSDPDALHPQRLSPRTDADLALLARGLHGFASRIADFSRRERNFTRDASHELRTPLTVIRMSVDMLADENGISAAGQRSLRRIHRASREMESLVDVLLLLAREPDAVLDTERFIVNDVLRREMDIARDLLAGPQIELQLDEPARFALGGSSRAFSVLCWQLIRDACQRVGRGKVVVRVLPGAVSVSHHTDAGVPPSSATEPCSFELSIAQRISDRFAWPLEWQAVSGASDVACIRFPQPLPAAG